MTGQDPRLEAVHHRLWTTSLSLFTRDSCIIIQCKLVTIPRLSPVAEANGCCSSINKYQKFTGVDFWCTRAAVFNLEDHHQVGHCTLAVVDNFEFEYEHELAGNSLIACYIRRYMSCCISENAISKMFSSAACRVHIPSQGARYCNVFDTTRSC